MRWGAALLGALVLPACLVTRLGRPHVVAQVTDAAGTPLAGVEVHTGAGAEAVTDAAGRFSLPAETYDEWTWPGLEAPPVRLRLELRKAGYQPLPVERFNPHGGAGSPDVPWALEPLRLSAAP